MEGAEQPALLERTVGGIRAQELPKDQGLRLRHLPRDGRDEIAVELAKAADTFVAVDDHVCRARPHDHDRHLLPGVRERCQPPPLSRGLTYAEPLVAQIQLMKFELHGGVSVAPAIRDPPRRHVQLRTRPPTDDAVLP